VDESILSIRRSDAVEAAVPAVVNPKFAGDTPATTSGFTLIELLVVIAIIIILAGLILSTVGYVQKKGARSRAEAEIAAISAACESYKADNGIYPTNGATDSLNPSNYSADYDPASLYLYISLSGDTNANRSIDAGETNKSYFSFRTNQLGPIDQTQPVAYISDPFRNAYGYSTAKASNPSGNVGNNPTFDLWSTAGDTTGNQLLWIKNW
jgi:prepilin-type N-terminal cleavage/methylation domain-containing protein